MRAFLARCVSLMGGVVGIPNKCLVFNWIRVWMAGMGVGGHARPGTCVGEANKDRATEGFLLILV